MRKFFFGKLHINCPQKWEKKQTANGVNEIMAKKKIVSYNLEFWIRI